MVKKRHRHVAKKLLKHAYMHRNYSIVACVSRRIELSDAKRSLLTIHKLNVLHFRSLSQTHLSLLSLSCSLFLHWTSGMLDTSIQYTDTYAKYWDIHCERCPVSTSTTHNYYSVLFNSNRNKLTTSSSIVACVWSNLQQHNMTKVGWLTTR